MAANAERVAAAFPEAANEGEGVFGGGGAVHAEALGGEAFVQEQAQGFFIVEDEDAAAFENFGGGGYGVRGRGFRGCGGSRGDRWRRKGGCGGDSGLQRSRSFQFLEWRYFGGRFFRRSGGQSDGEQGAARGKRLGFDEPAMLADDGHADAQAEAGAAAGTLGGVEGIEDARKSFGADADAVVLKGDDDAVAAAAGANLEAAGLADFADGLLGVGDEIQEDLDELVGVTQDAGKTSVGEKVHFDVVAAQGVFVKLERALDEIVDVEKLLLRRTGTREFEQVLHDARGAAGLAMGEIELAHEGFVLASLASALAKKFGDAEDGGERVVQFVGDAGEHLAHGGEFLGLDELLFEALEVGDVAAGEHHAFDVAGFVGERAEVEKNAAPIALFAADAHFQGLVGSSGGNDVVVEHADGRHFFGMDTVPETERGEFRRFVAEDFAGARADESVLGVGIENEDHVGEIVDQAAGKLLLLAEAALDFAALG